MNLASITKIRDALLLLFIHRTQRYSNTVNEMSHRTQHMIEYAQKRNE